MMSEMSAITAIMEAIKILRAANLNPTALVLDKEGYQGTQYAVLSCIRNSQNVPYTPGITIDHVRIIEDLFLKKIEEDSWKLQVAIQGLNRASEGLDFIKKAVDYKIDRCTEQEKCWEQNESGAFSSGNRGEKAPDGEKS